MVIDGVMVIIILFFYINNILSLHRVEINFLEKLINFNSPNFDDYIKKIDEFKKKLRNDTNEDDDKGDDMDFNDDSKKKEEENKEGKEKNEGKSYEKNTNNRKTNKQNKIQQQRKKKLQAMKLYFTKKNILFILKILFIIIMTFVYYVISEIMQNNYKNSYLSFDSINDSIISAYKQSYDIFIPLKRELDLYELYYINC
jgi:hypothetical protein